MENIDNLDTTGPDNIEIPVEQNIEIPDIDLDTDNKSNILGYVADKKYTEFSDAVKQELLNKLSNTSAIQDYKNEYERIVKMKDLFAQISQS